MSQDNAQLGNWIKRAAVDSAGDKIGTITDVYVDNETGHPDWLAVSTGTFGSRVSFVPIEGASLSGDDVMVGFTKAKIKDAPNTEADGQLSIEEEQTLYAYYGRGYQSSAATTSAPAATPTISSDTTRRDASVVRSEEELSVNKRTEEAGRVRLRKWVETENVQVTVPVEKQKARVVRESVAPGDTAGVGDFVEGEEEIVLSEEVVDVSKRAVAKERVGIEKETVTEQVPVNDTVRKERVEVEGGDVTEGELRDRR